MKRYPVLNQILLGQANSEPNTPPVQVDQAMAEYGRSAINLLKAFQTDDSEAISTPCWRELMILHRSDVERLYVDLEAFSSGKGTTLILPASQYELFDKIVACLFSIEDAESEARALNLQYAATLVGALGGLAALIALAGV
jgi:hypothetical protein